MRLRYYLCGEYGPRTYRPWALYSSSIARNVPRKYNYSYLRVGNMVMYMTPILSKEAQVNTAQVILIALVSCLSYITTSGLDRSPLFSKAPAIGTLYPVLSDEYALWE